MILLSLMMFSPHPESEFRYQEILGYLQNFNSIKVLSTGSSIHVLGKETINELLINFKRKFPNTGGKLETFSSFEDINCKLFYFVFLQNAFLFLEIAERRGIPFVFTLYPGGGFFFGNATSDIMLKQVLDSPCFRKVIVTQKVIYDHLIKLNFCKPEQIEYIFGAVIPLEKLERKYMDKKHFKIDKENLDICFIAHEYISNGQDKCFDVFVDVAKQLSQLHRNIHFHIVGNLDTKAFDISEIRDNVTFYEVQSPDWFDKFYKDKDIILSPNVPSTIDVGLFEGFPTSSCITTALCKTAIFCTDPLNLNNAQFKDNEQIVIINSTTAKIMDRIEYYYNNPEELKGICEKGYEAINDFYGFDKQIAPRIGLLKSNIQ